MDALLVLSREQYGKNGPSSVLSCSANTIRQPDLTSERRYAYPLVSRSLSTVYRFDGPIAADNVNDSQGPRNWGSFFEEIATSGRTSRRPRRKKVARRSRLPREKPAAENPARSSLVKVERGFPLGWPRRPILLRNCENSLLFVRARVFARPSGRPIRWSGTGRQRARPRLFGPGL